ncbi:MAG: twin-arginine translocase TatA/TatE family subunit [Actinomycetes bacterium]
MALFEKPAFLILILLVLLLFGAKRLPDLARGVGRSLRIFKAETDGLKSDSNSATATVIDPPAVAAPPAPAQPATPRYLVDPITGEQVLAQPLATPVAPPTDGVPRV